MCVIASAQSRQQLKTDSVFKLVKARINDKDAAGLYALMGSKYKSVIHSQTLRDIMERDMFPYGQIKSDSLISFINNNQAMYNVQFDAITYHLIMILDETDKIQTLVFQPARNKPTIKNYKVPTSNPMVSAMDKLVDSLARLYIQKSNTVGLNIGIIKDGKTSIYSYGETARGNKNLPDNNTIFELGSITKTFTATLLAYYVNQGKISLNDPIIKFLPPTVAANTALANIKLVNLSNHTSGLPGIPDNFSLQRPYDQGNPYQNYNRQLLFDYLAKCSLNSKPGEKYQYSNMAVGLLGVILEKVSGKSFEQMVSEIITKPLGMKSTVQHLYPMIASRFAQVYDSDGNITQAWDFDALASAGSLRSSIGDMLLYAKANMNTKGTGPLYKAINLTHQITLNNDARVGLGWHISIINGVDYYYHSGGTGGSSSFIALNPVKNLAVVILSNADESTDNLGVDLVKKLQ